MKKSIFIIIALSMLQITFVCGQTKQQIMLEKIVDIADVRSKGLNYHNTATENRVADEVFVERCLSLKPAWSESARDTLEKYTIHFYKNQESKLKNYQFSYLGEEIFDKASYSWLNDTTVSVNLINSETKKYQNMTLVKAGNNTALLPPSR